MSRNKLRSRKTIRQLAAHNERILEQERARIARELHDELGQHLTALQFQIKALQTQLATSDKAVGNSLSDVIGGIDDIIQIVQDITSRLRPPVLDAGLVLAVSWLLEKFVEPAGIQSDLQSDTSEFALTEEIRITAFRVIQESLTNVVRHSRATEVLVWLSQNAGELTIVVSDNGIGFVYDAMETEHSFGLIGIRERVLILGGCTDIISRPGQGSSLVISIPLLQTHNNNYKGI